MSNQKSSVPSGWIGGFAQSNPAFAYPNPDLSSLPMLCNMDNIPRITRQQRIYWPEFSWETKKGDPDSRCFQRFAHDISSIGYDDTGRVWSIICPQQGVWLHSIGSLNVEITVTGQRGWVDETNQKFPLAADMTVEAKLWFSPNSHQNRFVQLLWDLFKEKSLPFPSDKGNAIQVSTHKVGKPEQAIFPVRAGQNSTFNSPDFAKHPKAWTVGNIEVEIGKIIPKNHPTVDSFNEKILDLFNMSSGNMLQAGNVLTWNLWFRVPQLVDREKWRTHAERWRKSIDVNHCSPDGSVSSPARYRDGSLFKPCKDLVEEIDDIIRIVEDLL